MSARDASHSPPAMKSSAAALTARYADEKAHITCPIDSPTTRWSTSAGVTSPSPFVSR